MIELAKDLRLKPVYCLGHLHALWHAALEQQEDGDLSSWSDDLIADASCYSGDAPQYVSLLQSHGWLDGKLLHDWLDYAGNYLVRKYHNSNRRWLQGVWLRHGRRYGKSTSLSHPKGRSPPSKVRLSPVGKVLNPDPEWPSPEKLVELYNTLTPDECPEVTKLSPGRKAKAKLYLTIFPELEFWQQVFKRVHNSQFLKGLKNSPGHKGFKFDFDWMLTKNQDGTENALKVYEGRYQDGQASFG